MLEANLTPCANLLYHWLYGRIPARTPLKFDLQDFQAWTGEHREKPCSDREIFDAVAQLKQLHLIALAKTEARLTVKPLNNLSLKTLQPLPLSDSDRPQPNRFSLFLRITSASLLLSLTSVGLGLGLAQIQPMTLTTPHPWSVLGERNIG